MISPAWDSSQWEGEGEGDPPWGPLDPTTDHLLPEEQNPGIPGQFLFPRNLFDHVMEKLVLRGRWREHPIAVKFGFGPEWCKLTVVSILAKGRGDGKDSSWVHNPLGGCLFILHLKRGFCIISIDKQVRNVVSMSQDWKSTSSREDVFPCLELYDKIF